MVTEPPSHGYATPSQSTTIDVGGKEVNSSLHNSSEALHLSLSVGNRQVRAGTTKKPLASAV
jgi:hypothetical protein